MNDKNFRRALIVGIAIVLVASCVICRTLAEGVPLERGTAGLTIKAREKILSTTSTPTPVPGFGAWISARDSVDIYVDKVLTAPDQESWVGVQELDIVCLRTGCPKGLVLTTILMGKQEGWDISSSGCTETYLRYQAATTETIEFDCLEWLPTPTATPTPTLVPTLPPTVTLTMVVISMPATPTAIPPAGDAGGFFVD